MKYFRIEFGCSCGNNEEYMKFETLEAAENYAYESAIENYHSYEGLHGIRDIYNIAIEDFGVEELDEVYENDKALYNDIENTYEQEIESSISYCAEEISEREYLIAIGELDEDE